MATAAKNKNCVIPLRNKRRRNPEILSEVRNEEDGMKTVVAKVDDGYSVALFDMDAEQYVDGFTKIYPTLEQAEDRALEVLGPRPGEKSLQFDPVGHTFGYNPRRRKKRRNFSEDDLDVFDCQSAYDEGYNDGFDDAEIEDYAFENPKRGKGKRAILARMSRNRKRNPEWEYFKTEAAAGNYAEKLKREGAKYITLGQFEGDGADLHNWWVRWTTANEFNKMSARVARLAGNRRRNPEGPAADLYESFHGREADTDTIFTEEVHEHSTFAALGDLVSMKVATIHGKEADITAADPETAQAEDVVHLASNEDGTQLFFIGGDQALDLESLGFEDHELSKESVVVGIITELMYRTQKEFDKFEMIDYFHHLSEDTKRPQPSLLYDTINKSMSVSGGSYYIDQPMGEMSPGIED